MRYGTLEEKLKNLETVKRSNCSDCGNPWWFDEPQSWVCTTCAKTRGKSTGDEIDGWAERNREYRDRIKSEKCL
jgi:hypothetical protein